MENLLASTFIFTHFQSITQRYKWRNSIKAPLQSIQPLRKIQYAQLSKCMPQLSIKKEGVSLNHGVPLHFVSSYFGQHSMQKNSIRSAPASTAPIQVLHRSRNARTANRHLCGCGERNGAQRRTKVSVARTMILALELPQLAKRHTSGRSNVELGRNHACSVSH